MDIKKSIKDEMVALATECGIQKMILFGSRARGDNTARSDIDIAVSGGNIALFRTEIDDYVNTLLIFDVVNLDNMVQEELLKTIEQEGIVLYEKA